MVAQRPVPANVLWKADLNRVLWRIPQQSSRLGDTQRPSEGHEIITLDTLNLHVRKVLFNNVNEVLDRTRTTISHVKNLIARRRLRDSKADPFNEVVDVSKIQSLAPVAVNSQFGPLQRAFYEDLPYSPADATRSV